MSFSFCAIYCTLSIITASHFSVSKHISSIVFTLFLNFFSYIFIRNKYEISSIKHLSFYKYVQACYSSISSGRILMVVYRLVLSDSYRQGVLTSHNQWLYKLCFQIQSNTTLLYSDASIFPRRTHAASQICFSNPIFAEAWAFSISVLLQI